MPRQTTVSDGSKILSMRTMAKGASVWIDFCRQIVLRQLKGITLGTLVVEEQTGSGAATSFTFGAAQPDLPRVRLRISDLRAYPLLLLKGSIGSAEGYMAGYWSTDDLVGLVRIMVRNRGALDGLDGPFTRLAGSLFKAEHWLRRNHKARSRKNIAAHYDLSNAFFKTFLDESMLYSAALFDPPEASLHEASIRKIDHICRKLRLGPKDHVIEIGTGWGAFAIHAAKEYGARVTTTTISKEQYEYSRELIKAAGLENQITLLNVDYRDLTGQFDKLVSIEMIEAVGHQYLDTFFAKCASLLKPQGQAAIQAITITDQEYERAINEVDFIKKYIFPGGFMPSVTAMTSSMTRVSDLRLVHLEDITPHYARTLHAWRKNFLENLEQVRALGISEPFIRMWEFYFCYCEGAFLERFIGNVQMVLTKSGATFQPLLARSDR